MKVKMNCNYSDRLNQGFAAVVDAAIAAKLGMEVNK